MRAVCVDDALADDDVLALLPALVDKSLVAAEPREEATRFRLLETLRQYALDKLTQAGEVVATRDRHLRWVVSLSEQVEQALAGSGQRSWTRRCELELDNLRGALAWAEQTGQRDEGLRAAAVPRLWPFLGRLTEGRVWIDRLLDGFGGGDDDPAVRARGLEILGYLALLQGDRGLGRRHLDAARAVYETLENADGVVDVLDDLSQLAMVEGDLAEARQLLVVTREWLSLARDAGWLARVACREGQLALLEGDYEQAEARGAEAVTGYRARGDSHGLSGALKLVGRIALDFGDLAMAREHLESALEATRGFCTVCTENLLYDLAQVVKRQGETALVEALLDERRELREKLGLSSDAELA